MRVTEIIKVKGDEVVSLPPTATVAELVELLAKRGIGAVVVMDGDSLAGIVSERDVVRHVADTGLLDVPVSQIMTTTVTTCSPDDDLPDLANVVTQQRVRHLPVVEDDRVVALVSIGDIVKARLDDLEAERDHLAGYVHG